MGFWSTLGDIGKGLLSSVTGGLVNAGSQILSSNYNVSQQKKLMDYQNQLNQQNWVTNNEYNSPVNQRSRMIEAGYNPALINSDGSVAQPMQAGLGTAQPVDFGSGLPSGDALLDTFNRASEVQADVEYKRALTATEDGLRSGRLRLLGSEFDLNESYRSLNDAQCKKTAAEIVKLEREADKILSDVAREWQQLDLQRQSVAADVLIKKLDAQLKQKDIDTYAVRFALFQLKERAGINLLDSQTKLAEASAEHQSAQAYESGTRAMNNLQDLTTKKAEYSLNYSPNGQSVYSDSAAGRRMSYELEKLCEEAYGANAHNLKFNVNSPEEFLRGLILTFRESVPVLVMSK